MYVISKKTKQLQKKEIALICKLKNTHWKFGFKSNLSWFEENVKKNDIHNLMFFNTKLIGYTLLRVRTLCVEKIKKKYLYFDTLIIDKEFRSKKNSYLLMNFNNQIILKMNKISFLLCETKLIKYYKKFQWKKINKKIFSLKNKKFNLNENEIKSNERKLNLNGMFFNNKNFNNRKYIFFLYK